MMVKWRHQRKGKWQRDDEDDNDSVDNVLKLPTLDGDGNEWDGHLVYIFMEIHYNNNTSTWGSCWYYGRAHSTFACYPCSVKHLAK